MLILTRKLQEGIVIAGNITVKIVRIQRGRVADSDSVSLGITAPRDLSVHRQEIQDLIVKPKPV